MGVTWGHGTGVREGGTSWVGGYVEGGYVGGRGCTLGGGGVVRWGDGGSEGVREGVRRGLGYVGRGEGGGYVQSLLSLTPVRIHLERLQVNLAFFCDRFKSDILYFAFTGSLSAIFCPFSSPGLWISYLKMTHNILFKTSLSLSGSRFVLTFELHDNLLKKFLFSAIISSSSPPFMS